jgi:hypothetical protein
LSFFLCTLASLRLCVASLSFAFNSEPGTAFMPFAERLTG